MKKRSVLISATIAVAAFLWLSLYTQAYDLTAKDEALIDRAEQKLIQIIEKNDSDKITAEYVVDKLDTILETRSLNERVYTVLDEIAYRIWDYAGLDEEVLTQEDCYDDEYFDEEDQWCYLKEHSDDDNDNEAYGSDDDHDYHSTEDKEYDEALAIYQNTDKSIKLQEGTDDKEYQEIWDTFSGLFPTRYTAFITEVIFYDNTNSDTAAFVERHEWSAGTWKLAINLDWLNWDNDQQAIKENAELFVHEMAHIITLNDSQMSFTLPTDASDTLYNKYEKRCGTHFVMEWCLAPKSYVQEFVEAFWTDAMLQKVANEQDVYSGKEKNFVSDYAATNEGEDIAESYALYVVNPLSEDDWTVAWDKLNFFSQYSELTSLRSYIRKQLSSH